MWNLVGKMIGGRRGEIEMKGEGCLMGICGGLKNELRGKEKIGLKWLMMGVKNGEIEEVYEKMVELGDMGEFIDEGVKRY